MKKILTYGTFDLLHDGHINLLRRARALGDYLIVGLSTDEFNQKKHKQASLSYPQRKKVLEAIKYVDLVIPEKTWAQKILDVKKHDVNIFVMGDDWKNEFDFLQEFCEVRYLKRTPKISTTEIKVKIRNKK